ncbi:MAG: hypothetical protein HY754_02450 [Nitrospirae bacterium]|nr:hypothetical protein [Nitrospirota bacterium]
MREIFRAKKNRYVFGRRIRIEDLKEIRERLDPLIRKDCPFKVEPNNTPATWVKPELVCEVIFHGWTDEGLLRQPVFLRLRDDKSANPSSAVAD